MKHTKRFSLTLIIMLFVGLFCEIQAQNKQAKSENYSVEISENIPVKKAIWNIRALGMDVGTITVTQRQEADRIYVEAISQVEVRIIFKIKVKYIQTSIYENGELVESVLQTYKKEEVNSDTRLTKKGTGYELNKDGEISFVNDKINYSGSLLYFNEPSKVSDLYFEISGEKTSVKIMGDHQYQITDPHNGNKNEYSYKNGELKQAIIKHNIANVYMERQ